MPTRAALLPLYTLLPPCLCLLPLTCTSISCTALHCLPRHTGAACLFCIRWLNCVLTSSAASTERTGWRRTAVSAGGWPSSTLSVPAAPAAGWRRVAVRAPAAWAARRVALPPTAFGDSGRDVELLAPTTEGETRLPCCAAPRGTAAPLLALCRGGVTSSASLRYTIYSTFTSDCHHPFPCPR